MAVECGHGLGLRGDGLGPLMLPGLGQRPRDLGQGARLRVWVGDRAGDGLGLLSAARLAASAPATSARASASEPGR